LHEVVGPEVTQKGSYVGPDRLRFDFNSAPLAPDQLRAVERLVNSQVVADEVVSWTEIPFTEVQGNPAIMQFFGEKYGSLVRVVQIGGQPAQLNGFSMELCGGTHVRRTGQIGLFRITSEGAISAGVRRVEALTGLAAVDYINEREGSHTARIRDLSAELLELRKAVEKEQERAWQRQAVEYLSTAPKLPAVETIPDGSGDFLQAIGNLLKSRKTPGVLVLFGHVPGTINVFAYVGPGSPPSANAGKIVQELAGILEGKGGGRPDLARGVGRNSAKLAQAVSRAHELIRE
jgi:alanyl-tRNA synthetase